jgi:VIT1/CCC1 family predicted Fe2+/Mn2+ transporter
MGSSSYLSAKSEHAMSDAVQSKSPMSQAIATFSAFVVVGMVPMIPFVIALFTATDDWAFGASVATTGITFAAVGYASGVVTGQKPMHAAGRTVLVGTVAALIAFGVGRVLGSMLGTV